jgi:cytoskeleton protein RodZ
MVRLSANSIRVVADNDGAQDEVEITPAEHVNVPDHVGAWLREAREATGRDLRDVAAHLRIRYPYLLAIEEGRFDDLPGRAYAVGFIRSYSAHLGLDGEAMVERFKADADTVSVDQNLKFPTPAPEGRFPGSTALVVSAVLAAALIGGWYYYQNRGGVPRDRVPEPPQAAAPAATVPSPSPRVERSGGPVGMPAGTPNAGSPVDESAARQATAATAPEPVAPTETASAAATQPVETPSRLVAAPEQSVVALSAGQPGREVMVVTPPAEEAPPQPQYEQMAAAEPPVARAVSDRAPAVPATVETPSRAVTGAAEVVATPPAVVQPAAAPAPEPAASTAAPAPAAAAPGPAPAAAVATVAALPAVPAIAEPAGGRVYGLTNRDARIVLTAQGSSWIQVLDAGQNELFTNVLKPGESYRVPNRAGLVMRVGTPNALTISVDGAPAVPLSDSDQPIRDVTLDPQVLRDAIPAR